MFDFHSDKDVYFNFQFKTSKEYIIPFIDSIEPIKQDYKVLEIGCAEAGVLKAFTDLNIKCFGIELSPSRTKLAKNYLSSEVEAGLISFLSKDIYDVDILNDIGFKFDLIILKDVIEHIPNQKNVLHRLSDFLEEDGKIFFAFPPWQMPFGGHQQVCKSKVLMFLPYFHLLPMKVYTSILKLFGETPNAIKELKEIKETGISIERFEKILKEENYTTLAKQLFLINPIYKYKFGMKVVTQFAVIAKIPVLRNFLSTCAYYLVKKA